jgi:hypothetical protein
MLQNLEFMKQQKIHRNVWVLGLGSLLTDVIATAKAVKA